jgi:hypothetical protein
MTISEALTPMRAQPIQFEEYHCTECNTRVQERDTRFVSSVRNAMILHQRCYECHHWMSLIEYMGPCAMVRVEGQHYMFDTRLPYVANPLGALGHGGKMFVIYFRDSGEELITNNLWYQGKIPDRFKSRLPDNADFIPYEERRE